MFALTSSLSKGAIPAAVFLTFATASFGEELRILVDNTRSASDIQYSVETGIFAFRSLANGPFGEVGVEPIRIPRDIIERSVLSFSEINDALSASGLDLSDITLDQMKELIASTSYDEKNLFQSESARPASFDQISFRSKPVPLPGVVVPRDPIAKELTILTFNASAIANLVASGALEEASIGVYEIGEEESRTIRHLASNLYHVSAYRNDIAGSAFAELLDDVRKYDSLSKSFLAYRGRITFGLPIPSRAEEIGLILPEFVETNFDVYWLELTATYREMADDVLKEMVFNVSLPPDCVALELIPIRYGPSAEVSVDTKSPELKMKLGQAEISVGEFYGKKGNI